LIETLESIIHQQTSVDFEVLVLDNGCDPILQEVVNAISKSAPTRVSYIPVAKLGLLYCRHTGAREANGEIVVYVDDDVITPPGWLEAITKAYLNPTVACVGGKTIPKWEGEPPEWLPQFGKNGGGYLSMLDLGNETLELKWPQGVFGCNMSVRRSVIYETGGFNPDAIGDRKFIWLRGDGETGLHKKIYDAGYKVIYEPRAWLFHRVPASRLKPEHFYWRAYIQGISDSYTDMRINKPTVNQLFHHAGHSIWVTGRSYLRSYRHPKSRIRIRSDAWYWYGKAQHLWTTNT
jgi:glycosyltransferase involved in cell wall biosynthesis